MYRLDCNGMVRNFFALETAFGDREDFVNALIAAYDKAADRASLSARVAISTGGREAMAAARWDEAIALTIERILCMLPTNTDEGDSEGDKTFDPPKCPDFET